MQIKIGDKIKIKWGDEVREVKVKEIYKEAGQTHVKVSIDWSIFGFTYDYELDWLRNRILAVNDFNSRQQLTTLEL